MQNLREYILYKDKHREKIYKLEKLINTLRSTQNVKIDGLMAILFNFEHKRPWDASKKQA